MTACTTLSSGTLRRATQFISNSPFPRSPKHLGQLRKSVDDLALLSFKSDVSGVCPLILTGIWLDRAKASKASPTTSKILQNRSQLFNISLLYNFNFHKTTFWPIKVQKCSYLIPATAAYTSPLFTVYRCCALHCLLTSLATVFRLRLLVWEWGLISRKWKKTRSTRKFSWFLIIQGKYIVLRLSKN